MLYILAGNPGIAEKWADKFEMMPAEWTYIGNSRHLIGASGGKFVACPTWFNNNGHGPWSSAREIIHRLAIMGATRDFERQAIIDLEERHQRAVRRSVERHLARATAVNAERVNAEPIEGVAL